jgi:hypothetical protein
MRLVQIIGQFRFDTGVTDALVFNVPMELCLELVTIVGSDFAIAKGKLFDDVVDKRDRASLVVTLVDFEGPDTGRVVNSGVLITLGFQVKNKNSQHRGSPRIRSRSYF